MATAAQSRQIGRDFSHGDATLTAYAIARPKHCVLTSGCQNGRGSSIDMIAAKPVLMPTIKRIVSHEA